MAREKGILFHTDAVQAFGKRAIELKSTKKDTLCLPNTSSIAFNMSKATGVCCS